MTVTRSGEITCKCLVGPPTGADLDVHDDECPAAEGQTWKPGGYEQRREEQALRVREAFGGKGT